MAAFRADAAQLLGHGQTVGAVERYTEGLLHVCRVEVGACTP
jgi:hypothetical protein